MSSSKQGPPTEQFGKWNFIKFFMDDPCDAPYSAYALAMTGAALEAFVALYSLDLGNMFFSALQSGSGINRKRSYKKGALGQKGKPGPGRKKPGKGFSYDPSSQIGGALGRFSPLAKRPLPGPLGILFFVYGVLDFANFWFFFADVIEQFMFRWTSLLWQSQYCQARDDAIMMRDGPDYVHGAIFGPLPMQVPDVVKARGPITAVLSTFTIPGGWTGYCNGSALFESLNPGQPCTITYRMIKHGAFNVYDERSYTAEPGKEEVVGMSWELASGGTYSITEEISFGFGMVKSPVFMCQITENGRVPPMLSEGP
jgi:hypothetical protein